MEPERLYLEHLTTIERVAAFVARRGHLDRTDTDEFIQHVRVALLEGDYAILRKFEGRSSFTTFLTTVVFRLFHQYRVAQWGKWRPSAEARRLGEKAITLERLLTRDGFTFEEAVKVLTTPANSPYAAEELVRIYGFLPPRMPRAVSVREPQPEDAITSADEAEGLHRSGEREVASRTALHVIDTISASMSDEDQLLLRLRLRDSMRVPELARQLKIDQKRIYKRLDILFAKLRAGLERAGIARSDIDSIFLDTSRIRALGSIPADDEAPPRESSDGEMQ